MYSIKKENTRADKRSNFPEFKNHEWLRFGGDPAPHLFNSISTLTKTKKSDKKTPGFMLKSD